jgi:hypothetical protein
VGDRQHPRAGLEAKPKPKRALPRKNEGLTATSIVGAVGLFLIAAACLCLLITYRSLPLAGIASLVVIAALAVGGLAWFFMPARIDERTKRSIGAGVGIMTLILGLLAIPSNEIESTATPESGVSMSAAPPAPPDDDEPLYATLETDEEECESFVVKNNLLRSVPSPDDIDAEWVYNNGGYELAGDAEEGYTEVTIQGSPSYATILTRLRVTDLQIASAPKDVSVLDTCPRPTCCYSKVDPRHFDVILDPPGSVIGTPESPKITGPGIPKVKAPKFPYTVSADDVEAFDLKFGASSKCVCTFRLALHWTRAGHSGTKIIERRKGGFRTYISNDDDMRTYYRGDRDGTWDPALPK